MSDAFRLVERYHLSDATHLTLEMTYYDPKAWGDKPWTGWKKEFRLDAKTDSLQENVCDTARTYDDVIENPAKPKEGDPLLVGRRFHRQRASIRVRNLADNNAYVSSTLRGAGRNG